MPVRERTDQQVPETPHSFFEVTIFWLVLGSSQRSEPAPAEVTGLSPSFSADEGDDICVGAAVAWSYSLCLSKFTGKVSKVTVEFGADGSRDRDRGGQTCR